MFRSNISHYFCNGSAPFSIIDSYQLPIHVGWVCHWAENIKNCSGNLRTAIVLGSENLGLRRLTKEKISVSAKIPIAVQTESLNVSNAAAIALYVIQN